MSDTVETIKEEPLQEPIPNVYLVYPEDDGSDRPCNPYSQV
jgi:hypothetical protein